MVRGIYVKIYLGNSFVFVSDHVLCAKDVVLCQTPGKYGEDICYQMAQVMCNHVRRRAFIKTVATGMENLPKEDGYIMYANHQGKYDVLGVIVSHDKPITYVMDARGRSCS